MYLIFVDTNGEENILGAFDKIAVDGRTDDGITFLCEKDGETERVTAPFSFEIVSESFYNAP